MEFPDDVLRIIREYSRPVTRPDWKRLQKMSLDEFGVRLFAHGRSHVTQPIFMRTFKKVCRVSQDKLEIPAPSVPHYCAFHGNGCTTKSKTKRHCSSCNTSVCRSCDKCPLHK
jgi:hypothetical protein